MEEQKDLRTEAQRISKLEEEIKEAHDTLWRMMVEDAVGEEMDNLTAYIRHLENEKDQQLD